MTPWQKADLVRYRFLKAKKTLEDVEILMQNKLWNMAVNRLYYACYYAVSALLASADIYSKTHSGTRQMFGLHFVATGKIKKLTGDYYSQIFTYRSRGDYEDFFDFNEEDVVALIRPASELIGEIEKMLAGAE